MRKIISCFLAFAIGISLVAPAFAASSQNKILSYFDWTASCLSPLYNTIKKFLPSSVTPEKATDEDWQQAYNSYVSQLPAQGLQSDGYLIWYPKVKWGSFSADNGNTFVYWGDTSSKSDSIKWSVSVAEGNPAVISAGYTGGDKAPSPYFDVYLYFEDAAPIEGFYNYSYYLGYSGSYVASSSVEAHPIPPGTPKFSSDYTYYAKGATLSARCTISSFRLSQVTYIRLSVPVVCRVKPLDGVINPSTDTTLGSSTRPGTLVGLYGDVNGSAFSGNKVSLVDETNNTIYNPVTNTTNNITNWTYDYSSRTYTVTLSTGDTQTITYGDQYVTIKEGDTIYNIYYLSDGSGNSGTDTPGSCKHDYTSEVTTAATCEAAGLRTYTCTKCGNTYTERIPATGHSWTVKESVNTEYGEDGSVITQGYTIYKCSVCSTEYKDTDGTGPPNSAGGNSIWDKLGSFIGGLGSGILELVESVLGALLDALTSLVTMIADKLRAVVDLILSIFDEVPALFGGFLAFLSAVFPYVPDDLVLLVTFGLAAVIFLGILRAIRRF